MKNFLLLTVFFLLVFKSLGQIEKGTFQAGIGGLPIIFNDSSPTGYSLRANIGFFLTNKLSVGLIPFVGKIDDINSRGISLYSRYYFRDKKVSLFLEG
ncbi:MAG: hypothetical protein AAF391_12860, partial [Bacteroidota bacterium]